MESEHNSTLDVTLKCGMDTSFKIKPGLEIFGNASMYVLHYNRITDTVKFEVNKADTSCSLNQDNDTSCNINQDKNRDKDDGAQIADCLDVPADGLTVKRPPPYPSDSKLSLIHI